MKYLALLTLAMASVACEPTREEIRDNQEATKESFANPHEIGVLPDGRLVKCVVKPRLHGHDHYIYFVDGVVTNNHDIPQGKTTTNQVSVWIGGIEYKPVEKGQ